MRNRPILPTPTIPRLLSIPARLHISPRRLLPALILALCALTILPPSPPRIHADGGAPNLAYVVAGGSHANELDVIDIGQRQLTWRLALTGQPHSVLLSADSREVYVTEPAASRLAIIDARAHTISASIAIPAQPAAMALDLSSSPNVLYIAEQGGSTIAVVDPTARHLVATIPIGSHPSAIAIAGSSSGVSNPNDPEIYVTNLASDTVTVISSHARRVIATIPIVGGPLGVTIPATGGVAYVTTRSGAVVAISATTHAVLGTILQTPADAFGVMDYDAITGQIYLPDATTGAVDILAPVASATDSAAAFTPPAEPARRLTGYTSPAAVAITFEGAYGFVAERSSGQVVMLDAATHQTLATIRIGGSPQAIITGANPPLVSSNTAFLLDLLVLALILAMPIFLFISERRYRNKKRAATATPKPIP